MPSCSKCVVHGHQFDRPYEPAHFLEGKQSSLIWIVGLNPKDDGHGADTRSRDDLDAHFDSGRPRHSYFSDFRTVSQVLFDGLGVEGGTAHTDIVKCASKSFPSGRTGATLIANCASYLEIQIRTNKPRIIVCNGAEVSRFMMSFVPPPASAHASDTSYWTDFEGTRVCVVLSGFIGRIDNYAKRRLGAEIEARIRELKADAPPSAASIS